MEIDLTKFAGSVERAVESEERDGRPTKVVVAAKSYPSAIADVWDALTNAERIPRWIGKVTGDLRLGGQYQLEGNASGTITNCEPPSFLALTWEYGGEVSWVEVRLTEEAPESTRLQLRHVAFVDDERWREYGPGAFGVGWDLTLLGMENHLAGGEPVDPEQFGAAPEAITLMTRCSDAWGEASIADGTPESDAREAAARTTAFYTGAPG